MTVQKFFPSLRITNLLFNESGDGKTRLDCHFSYISKRARDFVDSGHSILNPEQYLQMMTWSGIPEKPSTIQGAVPLLLNFSCQCFSRSCFQADRKRQPYF
jgi:hypothetical protein